MTRNVLIPLLATLPLIACAMDDDSFESTTQASNANIVNPVEGLYHGEIVQQATTDDAPFCSFNVLDGVIEVVDEGTYHLNLVDYPGAYEECFFGAGHVADCGDHVRKQVYDYRPWGIDMLITFETLRKDYKAIWTSDTQFSEQVAMRIHCEGEACGSFGFPVDARGCTAMGRAEYKLVD